MSSLYAYRPHLLPLGLRPRLQSTDTPVCVCECAGMCAMELQMAKMFRPHLFRSYQAPESAFPRVLLSRRSVQRTRRRKGRMMIHYITLSESQCMHRLSAFSTIIFLDLSVPCLIPQFFLMSRLDPISLFDPTTLFASITRLFLIYLFVLSVVSSTTIIGSFFLRPVMPSVGRTGTFTGGHGETAKYVRCRCGCVFQTEGVQRRSSMRSFRL